MADRCMRVQRFQWMQEHKEGTETAAEQNVCTLCMQEQDRCWLYYGRRTEFAKRELNGKQRPPSNQEV
jgi:hypothetical protein